MVIKLLVDLMKMFERWGRRWRQEYNTISFCVKMWRNTCKLLDLSW